MENNWRKRVTLSFNYFVLVLAVTCMKPYLAKYRVIVDDVSVAVGFLGKDLTFSRICDCKGKYVKVGFFLMIWV